MKKLRFLIAIVLIFSLLPIFSVSAAEETNEVKPVETYAFKKLEAFGLINETDPIFYYENVKRNAFISYVMKCYSGYVADAAMPGIENPFADVTDKTEYVNAISAAAYTGLISGTKGSDFRPEEFITKSEAAKVFVTMLGYTDYAEMKGGYPSGYLAMAQSLGIFDGCEFSKEGYMTVKGFLRAYGNVLDTDILEVRSIISDKSGKLITQSYRVFEHKTLLYNVFGIYQAKGVVESNEYTSLYAPSTLGSDEVKINGYVYKVKDTFADTLLGYNTNYYYRNEENARCGELVYIEPYRNNVVNTKTQNIEKSAVTSTNFRYYKELDDNRYFDLQLANSVILIRNGEVKDATPENLCPANGTVTLIDYNDDRIYDVVVVLDYRTIIISSASSLDYKVMDSFGGRSIELDPEAEDYDVVMEVKQPVSKDTYYDVTYERYGEYLPPVKNEFSELKTGDTILYAASENNKKNIKYVKVSRDVIEGKIASSNTNDKFVVIDGQKYDVGPVMIEAPKTDENGQIVTDLQGHIVYNIVEKPLNISVGDEGVFYLDAYGRIVAQNIGNKTVYGYLEAMDKEDDPFGTVVRAKIFSESGRWLVLELAKTVKTNATSAGHTSIASLTSTAVYNALNGSQQLVTYTVNKEGKLNSLMVAQAVEAYSEDEKEAMSKDSFRSVYSSTWNSNSTDCKVAAGDAASYVGRYLAYTDIQVDDATRIFTICVDNPDLTRIEPRVKLLTDMGDGTFIPYDFNERRIAGAVVMFKEEEDYKVVYSSALMFVKSVVQGTNVNGELVNGIEALRNGEVVTYLASGKAVSDVLNSIKKGDIVQVSLNQNGEIYNTPPHAHKATETSIEVNLDAASTSAKGGVFRRFSADNPTKNLFDVTTADSNYGATCTVDFVDALASRVLVTGANNKKGFMGIKSTTKFYIYDTNKVEVTDATLADLAQGTVCFVKRTDYSATVVYIIKN